MPASVRRNLISFPLIPALCAMIPSAIALCNPLTFRIVMTVSPSSSTQGMTPSVYIDGVMPCVDDDGDTVITILNVKGLHKAIAEGIIAHKAGMSGKEMRFLRTEAGMTQSELAQIVHHDAQSIG